jgi:hypothetical protein
MNNNSGFSLREKMKNNSNQKINFRLATSKGAFIITLSILWSIGSRATNIFFLPNHKRIVVTGLIFFFSCSISLIFLLNKRINHFFLSRFKGAGRAFNISIMLTSLFVASLFIGNLLPTVSIPFQHKLKIRSLPNDENLENIIYINSIIEMIDAPAIGSNLIDTANIQVTGGNYSVKGSEITLEEGAVLTYSSFYSGCVRIIFRTTPESRMAFVQCDNIEKNYSLHSTGQDQTEINLCSRYPLNQLSFKWRFVVLSDIFLNIVALTSVFGLEIFFIFFKKTIVKSK